MDNFIGYYFSNRKEKIIMNRKIVDNYFNNKPNLFLIVIGVIVFAIGLLLKSGVMVLGMVLLAIPIVMYSSNKVSDEEYMKFVEEEIAKSKSEALSLLGISDNSIENENIFTWHFDDKVCTAIGFGKNHKERVRVLMDTGTTMPYITDGLNYTYIFFDKKKVYCVNVAKAMGLAFRQDGMYKENKSVINLSDISNIDSKIDDKKEFNECSTLYVISIQPSSGSGFRFATSDKNIYLKLKEIVDKKKSNA